MKKIFTLVLILVAAVIQSKSQGLVINEVDYDQPSTDTAEFIELYNSGSTPINLGVYAVILYNGNATTAGVYDSLQLPAQVLNPGSYFVICGNGGYVPLCDMIKNQLSNNIQNGSPDAIAILNTSTLQYVDVLSYEGTCPAPYTEGNGVPLANSDTVQQPFLGISRFPDGTDSNDDSTDFHRACITPGTANVNVNTGCQQPSSVNTLSSNKSLAFYPNPSTGIVSINLNGLQHDEVTLTVANMLGSVIKSIPVKSNDPIYKLNLSDLQDGIYFIKIKSGAGESIQRVIIRK